MTFNCLFNTYLLRVCYVADIILPPARNLAVIKTDYSSYLQGAYIRMRKDK